MKEYKTAKGWAIFIYIAAPIMIGFLFMPILLLLIPSWRTNETADFFWFAVPISLILIAYMIAGIADTIVSKVTLTEQSIEYKNILFSRSIQLNEIKGFRIDDKYLCIEPKTSGVKRIKISKYFGNLEDLIDFLDSKYHDLDELEAEERYQKIMENNSFGFSTSERQSQFQTARRSAKILNWVAGIIAAWTFFYPHPYLLAIIAAILCPIAAIVLLRLFNGLIHLEEKKNSPHPSVFLAFFIPSMALFLRAMLDLNVYNFEKLWWLLPLMVLPLTAVVLLGSREFDWRKGQSILMALVVLGITSAYGFGAILCTNCALDQSNAAEFHAQILGKDRSTGKTTTYHLSLEPLDFDYPLDEAQVDKVTYQRVAISDTVRVLFFEGRWGIPWLEVRP
ncbi:MAG: hypothetical protein SFV55_04870 [Haliscomenobacter sp.]|uniref:hypothetical protein n=1 Tax=Haliscomenobacter sp. TaxID=2717303 RepID=UPI0029B7F440|nr:hypothetical protein [Haliscomenobacter sp.]MDX2067735.1 hypothetical protein [Haliscomenobacter sp.]